MKVGYVACVLSLHSHALAEPLLVVVSSAALLGAEGGGLGAPT